MEENDFDRYMVVLCLDETLEKPFLAKEILENIISFFRGDFNLVETNAFSVKALDPVEGIPKYVAAASSSSRINSGAQPLKDAVDLMEYIVVNFSSAAEMLSHQILVWCARFLDRDMTNKAKSLVIDIASAIIRNCPCLHVDWVTILPKLKNYLITQKKAPPTLRKSLFSFFGEICKFFPESADEYHLWFFHHIVQTMTEFSQAKNPSDTLLEGCFNGLRGVLVNFRPPNQKIGDTIYQNMKRSSKFKHQIGQRNTLTKSAILVFSDHAQYFSHLIYNGYVDWHQILLEWISATQSEHKQLAIIALSKFYRVVVAHLNTESPDNEGDVFLYFSRHFSREFVMGNIYVVKDILSGLSEFASVYSRHLKEGELREVFEKIESMVNKLDDNFSILGILLETQSKIYSVLTNPPSHADLARNAVFLIENYPKIGPYFQPYCLLALENSFHAWLSCWENEMMSNYLDSVIYQGIIRSCAYPILADVQLLEGTKEEKVVSYKDFLSLWTYLLTISSHSSNSPVSEESKNIIGKTVFDAFVGNSLKIISKLDLGLVVLSNERSDPTVSMEAKCPHDFQIFVNLVDLFQEAIPAADLNHLWKWMPKILREMVEFSESSPLVSGFLKIIATCFQVALSGDVCESFKSCEDFLTDFLVAAIRRVDSQKEDLLIANLRMILLTPVFIISKHIHKIGTVFATGVRVGRGYPDLLGLCIGALGRWHDALPEELVQPVIASALPQLSSILLTPVAQQDKHHPWFAEKTSLKSRGKIRKKILGLNDRKLLTLQKQFLLFMAKLEPRVCLAYMEPIQNLVSIDDSVLSYRLPLPDAHLPLHLNALLPRVIELALSSADRATRVTACELLHAAVLLAVARTREPKSNTKLLQLLLEACLTLSCDSDRVVRDMFNSLVIQIAHYFSGRSHVESKESAVFIEVLIDGVTHSYDFNLRDFSAKCLREFVIWSAKQISSVRLSEAPYNVLGLLRIICGLSIHPNRCKRIGAILALNVLYSVIRENKEILNIYWLRLYYYFLSSLEMCTDDEDARLSIAAVNHIKRPFIELKELFTNCPAQRRIPPGFKGGTLIHVIMFTLKHCQSPNSYVREFAQSFVTEFITQEQTSLECFMRLNNLSIVFNYKVKGTIERRKCIAAISYAKWLILKDALDLNDLEHKTLMDETDFLFDAYLLKSTPNCEEIILILSYFTVAISGINARVVENVAKFLVEQNSRLKDERITPAFISFISELRKSSIYWSMFLSFLPSFTEEEIVTALTSESCQTRVAFFNCFEIMRASGSLTGEYWGDKIILPIFESLFHVRGRKTGCVPLVHAYTLCMQNMVKFALERDISVQLIVELLTNSSEVNDDGKKRTKGEYFFSIFKNQLVPFLVKSHSTSVLFRLTGKSGLIWIIKIIQHLRENKQNSDLLITRVIDDWENWTTSGLELSQLFALLQVLSTEKKTPCGCFVRNSFLCSWFYCTMKNMDYNDVPMFFELLPHFSSYEEMSNINLKKSLDIAERKHLFFGRGNVFKFPCFNYKRIFESLLSCFKLTGSLTVLKFFAEAIALNPSILTTDELALAMYQVTVKFQQNHVLEIIKLLYSLVFTELIDKMSIFFIAPLLTEVLKSSPNILLSKFCGECLTDLLKTMQGPLSHRKERDLARKIVATNIAKVVYMKTSQAERAAIQECMLGKDASSGGIFQKIIRSCEFDSLKFKSRTLEEAELLRLLNCACVNFMCVFAATFTEERQFKMFLFRKGLWESVVDDSKKYVFAMEFDNIPKRKVVDTAITKTEEEEEISPVGNIVYAQSHNSTLFNSTLSEDVQNFDLSHATVTSAETAASKKSSTMAIELEQDALNQHEVVPSICGLVRSMIHRDMPYWINYFIDTLNSSSRNTKLLILKIIYNLSGFVKEHRYDSILAPIILTSIIDLFADQPTNYIMIDLVNVLADWGTVLTGHGDNLTKLIIGIVERPGSLRREVVKFMFKVVVRVVENWKHMLSASELTGCLRKRTDVYKNDEILNYININLMSILVANKLLQTDSAGAKQFFTWLLNVLRETKNSEMAAEVLGMMLKSFEESEIFAEVLKSVCQHLRQMPSSNNTSDVTCLYHIHKFYPAISNSFVSLLVSRAWHDRSALKQQSLKLILSFVTSLGLEADVELATVFAPFAEDALTCNIVPAQETILSIILEVADFLKEETVVKLTPSVVKLSDHAAVNIRDLACSVLIKMFNRFERNSTSENTNTVMADSKIALLARVNDVDDKLREKCVDFWFQKNVHKSTKERILFVLSELYTPNTESDFVQCACRVILKASSLTPDYNLQIFQHPLEDCTFKDQPLLLSWRAQHASLAPMFVPSIVAELGRLDSDLELPQASQHTLQLRATAKSLLFAPTLSVDQYSGTLIPLPQTAGNELQFKKPQAPRFRRNTANVNIFFAKRAAATAAREKSSAEERIRQRDTGVTILGAYRAGDYPDISIKHENFQSLLTALLGRDPQFAKSLFVLLFTAIADYNKSDSGTFLDQATIHFNRILKLSNAEDSLALGALFQIAVSNQMPLASKDVCHIARSSGLLSTGVLLIEEAINNASDFEEGPTAPKRRRGPEDSTTDHWLRVAQLFHEMGDNLAVRGIFLDKLCVDGHEKDAIVSELVSDWSSAAANYEKVFNADADSTDRRHFYSQSYYSCLANLSDWGKLMDSIDQSVGDKRELWEENSWCSQVLLPWYMKSKMMVSLSQKTTVFQEYVKECAQDPEKSKRLAAFADEVSVAHWLNNDVAKAIYFRYKSFTTFLNEWSIVNEWDIPLKKSYITRLKVLAEIERIVTILSSKSQFSAVAQMLQDSSKETINEQSDLTSWDIRLHLRRRFLSFVNTNDACLVESSVVNSQLSLANAAIEQNNIELGRRCLLASRQMTMDPSQRARWECIRQLARVIEIKISKDNTERKLKNYLDRWNEVEVSAISRPQANRAIMTIIGLMLAECKRSNIDYDAMDFLPEGKSDLKKCWLTCANGLKSISQKGEVHVEVAKFYRENMPDSCWAPVVDALLKAMQCGNRNAIELFACIFTMKNREESEELENECKNVPTWMFLLWRNQYIAHLHEKNQSKMLRGILLRIAEEYPGSLSYGLRISKTSFSAEQNKERFVEKLSSLVLSNSVEESFVSAVGKLANPFLKIRYYLEKYEASLVEANKLLGEQVMQELKTIVSNSENDESYKPLREFQQGIEQLGELTDMEAIKLSLKQLNVAIKSTMHSKKLSPKLNNFSTWLSEFNWLKIDGNLEIPGQYTGLAEPQVENHVRVASFKPDVFIVKESLRQPIKLTMIGNNAQEYSFLVKFGEDLRQDERLQQILAHMNRTLQTSKATADLQLDGYGVIPLTPNLGIIEWVDSTKTITELMALNPEIVRQAAEEHCRFLAPKAKTPIEAHIYGYLNRTDDQAIAAFQSRVAFFNRYALRQGFWRLSASPEQFVGLRSNFAKTLAVMNIAQWILGVGDRHLNNILVSSRTGRALGIDFGMAFGFATQFLPLPELVPFRLTPQLVNVFSPLNEAGWLKQTMVHSLRVLREDPLVLLAMLEVFVLEPCLDWVQEAKRLAKLQGGDARADTKWYSESKVNSVREKLLGENPVVGLEKELTGGRTKDQLLLRQQEVLKGNISKVRFQLAGRGLTPEQQVDCLLDLATDPLVLSFTYVYWFPWL